MGMSEINLVTTDGEGARIGRLAADLSPRCASLVAAPVGA